MPDEQVRVTFTQRDEANLRKLARALIAIATEQLAAEEAARREAEAAV